MDTISEFRVEASSELREGQQEKRGERAREW